MAAEQGRSLAETPTWSVATVTTLMVAACFLVERSLSRFAKCLRKTKRKAMLAALEKICEELMLLGVISLLLSQTARFISEICVSSSLFTSRFYNCSESDYQDLLRNTDANQTALDRNMFGGQRLHVCGEGHEPFVLYEGLEQLHRFLFILGITHVLYSFVTVVLSMIKIYSWRKWETLAGPIAAEELKARRTKVMRRQSTFVFNNASHPWSKNKILIWMLCFLRQFKGSIIRSDYLALRLGFVTYHKLPHSYDFHKYMVRSMEDDYNGTIGIRRTTGPTRRSSKGNWTVEEVKLSLWFPKFVNSTHFQYNI